MSAINKIKNLIKKLESGDVDFIKKFQEDFIAFEKEYGSTNFSSKQFDYCTDSVENLSVEIVINSTDKHSEELINKTYLYLDEQKDIQEIDDGKHVGIAA